MENKIISEIKQYIKNFNIRLLTDVLQLIINNIDNRTMFVEFRYIEYKNSKKQYNIGILFRNLKFNQNIDLGLNNLLNINKLNFENITQNCWEEINWSVTDSDDDGVILFAFYCEDICIEYVKENVNSI
ncbi:hypothetical protein O2K51_01885 [Apibacter raozihei]|uniref:hypothetical protein n=1 Tax=Apibacter raozihei TaxID=2500547 RepID=UPI000FE41E24|nr:hypothetical protein [Apibacter raozihei]